MKDYPYFTSDELRCGCGKCDGGSMSDAFMSKLVAIREYLNFPLPISSAFRCEEHNRNVGGASSSLHLPDKNGNAHAVDIRIDRDRAYKVVEIARQFGMRGVGVSQKGSARFVHLDDRNQADMSFWSY
tara:strand:+ start:60 stop:443 length:384 start_codon:yes stop_codon:yes gene_type:complete